MKRSDIRGFTISLHNYRIEIVTVCHIPAVIALSKGIKTLLRIEY